MLSRSNLGANSSNIAQPSIPVSCSSRNSRVFKNNLNIVPIDYEDKTVDFGN